MRSWQSNTLEWAMCVREWGHLEAAHGLCLLAGCLEAAVPELHAHRHHILGSTLQFRSAPKHLQ